ncbi:MAG: IS3 family transposase [Flavobacteriaceae bacterium]|nr:IS3 family transposase [Flavobacteriaceae bacterium]
MMVSSDLTLGYKVDPLCSIFGRSRQAFYKWLRSPRIDELDLRLLLVDYVFELRKNVPNLGCRSIYDALPSTWPYGRDKTEKMLLNMGFRVKRERRYIRTTKPGTRFFDNLILGYEINNINRVWQSDMTFFQLKDGSHYYLIFIVDVYSQRIVGHGAYKHHPASVFLEVLNKAVQERNKEDLNGLIFHSDRGSEYSSTIFTRRIKSCGAVSSMAKYSWENPYAEKINDIIKNGYLHCFAPESFRALRRLLNRAVHNYNHLQRIRTLGKRTPVEYEELTALTHEENREVKKLKPEHRYELRLVKDESK